MLVLLIVISLYSTAVGQVGVCYGRVGNNLPNPSEVVALYKKNNITRMRLYDPYPPALQALGGSGIELMLGILNNDLEVLAKCQCHANAWVHANVMSYPNVKFRYIVVGNEIDPASNYGPFVFPAMKNIYNAISSAGLGGQITVSTSIKTDLLGKSSPPEAGEFRSNVTWFIKPIVEFLMDTGAPLLANIYPYFAYMNDMENISLSFALLQPNCGVFLGGVYYDNLFYAILDSVYAAMEKILAPAMAADQKNKEKTPRVTTSETESVGDADAFSSVENARIYNNNLMRIVKNGTPKRPSTPTETYIFAMFDENEKTGPEYERHFGIFYPDGKPKYPLRFY
ncbi:hypothetical protein C2S52_012578 [Perilla frutescens var. hirtella]|nr:hypothetical protein C2S52_012578 [Perilla frutescens var. hirtella]